MKIKLPSKKILIPLIAILLIAAAATPSYYFYNQYQIAQILLKNPTEELADAQWLVSFEKKSLKLPKGFTPDIGLLQRHSDKVIKS